MMTGSSARKSRSLAISEDNGNSSKERQPRRKKRHTSSRRKQQTLTQMDFVSLNNPDLEDFDLEYVVATDSHEIPMKNETHDAPPTRKVEFRTEAEYTPHNEEDSTYQETGHERPSKKRRKIRAQCFEPPQVYSGVQTRSSSRRISNYIENPPGAGGVVSQSEPSPDTRGPSFHRDEDVSQTEPDIHRLGVLPHTDPQTSSLKAKESQVVPDSDAIRMPPPRTPHKQKLKEIPSSQSPPATPWSIKSRISLKSPTQSPLHQKSVNATKSNCIASVRRKIQSRSEMEDAYNEDDKENKGSASTAVSPTGHRRRTPASTARLPLQHVISSNATERDVMADLATTTSAAASSIAEQNSLMEVATEIDDSDRERLSRGIVNFDDEGRSEKHRTSLEGHSTLSNTADPREQEAVSSIDHASDNGYELESQPFDSLLGPVQRVERTRSQSTVSTVLLTPTKTSNRLEARSDPTTPCRGLPKSILDSASLQLQTDLSKATQQPLTSSTTNSTAEGLNEPQESPTPRRSRRETQTPRSSRSVQRALELSVTKPANHRDVDLGVLAGWKRMTESQRLNDSLLQDSLGVESQWDVDLEPELDTQLSSQ